MNKNADFLVEWALWANLDSVNDLELILLKGHLYLDATMEILLNRNNIDRYENYSFYKKIGEIAVIQFKNREKHEFIFMSLFELNKLRSKLAHEFEFDVYEWVTAMVS